MHTGGYTERAVGVGNMVLALSNGGGRGGVINVDVDWRKG